MSKSMRDQNNSKFSSVVLWCTGVLVYWRTGVLAYCKVVYVVKLVPIQLESPSDAGSE